MPLAVQLGVADGRRLRHVARARRARRARRLQRRAQRRHAAAVAPALVLDACLGIYEALFLLRVSTAYC